ncbi:glycosyltransferase [Glaciecola siphonariae]|uniref:Glycosyltransferase n=1 Tax=Glaciecola siphonariae TaxID=521012 RepID=A0ABV9LYZ0_9ALTE
MINSTPLLESLGFAIDIATFKNEANLEYISDESTIFEFDSYLGTYSFSPSFNKWLLANLKNYNAVIIHGIWQFHSYAVARHCKKQKIPFVLFTHGMLDPYFNSVSFFKYIKKVLYWKVFENTTLSLASRVLFTSEEEKRCSALSFSPYEVNGEVIAYGSPDLSIKNTSTNRFYDTYPLLKNKQIFLFLSRIHPKKGIEVLINAISRLEKSGNDVAFCIAGPINESYKTKLEALISSLNISNKIHWLGMLDGELKHGAFKAADVFILPSFQENFGIVVAESLSLSTPVIISDRVNIWQEIKASKSGYVCEPSATGLVKAIEKWNTLSSEEKKIMSKNARSCYESQFSLQESAKDIARVIRDIAAVSP